MKTIFTLICCCVLSISWGQNSFINSISGMHVNKGVTQRSLQQARLSSTQKSSLDSVYGWFFDIHTTEPYLGAKTYFEYNPEGLLTLQKQDFREFEDQDFENNYLNTYEYDVFGNLIKNVHWSEWDALLGDWQYGRSVEIVYTSLGKESISTRKEWNAEQKIWVNAVMNESMYDQAGNLTFKVNKQWNESSDKWEIQSERRTSYNAANLKTVEIYSSNLTSDSVWGSVNTSYYNYSVDGLLVEQISKDDKWYYNDAQFDKKVKEYDLDGNLVKVSTYSSTDSLNWSLHNVEKTIYDVNRNVVLNSYEGLIYKDTSYVYGERSRDEFVYLSNKLQSKQSFYQGEPESKTGYTYAANGALISTTDYNFWDGEQLKWKYAKTEEYTYDYSYVFDDLILPILDDESKRFFDFMLLAINRYNVEEEIGNPELEDSVSLYYSNRVGLEDRKFEQVAFYPNPLTGSSILKFENTGAVAELKVQDVSGKIVFTKTSSSNEFVLHKSEFKATGLYIYTIQTAGDLVSGKLMVE